MLVHVIVHAIEGTGNILADSLFAVIWIFLGFKRIQQLGTFTVMK